MIVSRSKSGVFVLEALLGDLEPLTAVNGFSGFPSAKRYQFKGARALA